MCKKSTTTYCFDCIISLGSPVIQFNKQYTKSKMYSLLAITRNLNDTFSSLNYAQLASNNIFSKKLDIKYRSQKQFCCSMVYLRTCIFFQTRTVINLCGNISVQKKYFIVVQLCFIYILSYFLRLDIVFKGYHQMRLRD